MARRSGALQAGFTLVELLLAATLGAMLLIATATSAGMFGQQLTQAEAKSTSSLDEALSGVTDELRYAWWATVPDARDLTLCDSTGAQTRYQFANGKLTVTRPDGTTGTVIDNLQSCTFSADTVTRFREATPVSRGATFCSASAPIGVVQSTILDDGNVLALGFTPTSPAPVGGNPTAGVQEQMLDTSFTTLSVPVAAVGPVAATDKLAISLYRARSPNDARTEGAALATKSIDMSALPVADSYVWDLDKQKIVNVPHGVAWGWWKNHPNLLLVVTPPATSVNFDVSSFNQTIAPGYAYTVTLTPSGSGVVVASYAIASSSKSGVALDTGGGLAAQALAVARSESGTTRLTRSTASSTASRVLVNLVDTNANQASGSATVVGQSLAENSWQGVVPGETGP